jgi:hypothetical protein
MGISVLELVLRRLRELEIPADMAYPGQNSAMITGPVAAVHIEKVDRSNLAVTVGIRILCPASLGGSCCEMEALRVTEALHLAGADCIQNGCTYDGLSRLYAVSILATFNASTEDHDCSVVPGFKVYIQENLIPFAIAFRSEQTIGVKAIYEIGENAPTGTREGSTLWEFTLEELIPEGQEEAKHPEGEFELRLQSKTSAEAYCRCRWTSVRREFTRKGLRRIRSGISMYREVP